MSQLKPSYVEEIKKALSSSIFSLMDFDVELPVKGQTLLKITFKHVPEYTFIFREDERYEDVTTKRITGLGSTTTKQLVTELFVDVSPGNYKKRTTWTVRDFDSLPAQIPKWCQNIREDLYTLSPERDPMENLRKEFESQIEELVDDPEGYFTSLELDKVNEKFDSLFKKFEGLKQEYELNKQQLDKIRNEFEEFKSSAIAYPKGIWAKVTNNKLVDIVSSLFKSKEGRQFILEELKKLISN